jgi:outer membrane receptor protein involved in Fe transport
MRKSVVPFLFGTVSVLAVTAAMAQEAPGGLEQITVTARKRSESLQDVPVAVAAISKTQLENNVANSLEKIGELAPQVSIGKVTTGTGAVITIRGISSAGVDAGLDQSVSLSIDGVSLSRGRIVQAAMFDMQQVEVMKGPQALFFGKNSPAGVISITSTDPTNELSGYVRGGYEFKADERYIETAIAGPINDAFKARLALRGDWMEGFIKNVAPAQANPFQPFAPLPGANAGQDRSPRGHDIAGRFTLDFDPGNDFTAKLKVTMSSERTNGNAAYADNFCTNGLTSPNMLGVPQTHAGCAIDMVHAVSNYPPLLAINFPYGNGGVPYERSDLGLASLVMTKKFGDITVTSTTGFYDQATKGSFIGDFSEFAQIYDAEAERFRQFNQEIRANTDFGGPVNAMAGAYYEHTYRRWFNSPGILNIFNTVANNYTTSSTTSRSHGDSYSVFGQLRWKVIPDVEIAGGLRYTHDKKVSTLENFFSSPAAPLLGIFLYPDNTPLTAQFKGNNVSPEATITWKPTSDQTLYAAYKTGYKAGGIQNSALFDAASTSSNLVFGPEKVNGFEVGYKADLLANTLRFDVTAYRYNYNGLQVAAQKPPEFRTIIRNAAKARTYGVEGSVQWAATDRLTLDGNFGWNHARYLSFPNAQCWSGQTAALGCVGNAQDLTGRALQRAPNINFKLGADYKADIAAGWVADLAVSGAYSSSFETATDYSPGSIQDSYWLLNASVHVSPESEKYKISLIGRNLTNSYYRLDTHTQGIGSPYQFTGFFNRPREVLIQLEYKL